MAETDPAPEANFSVQPRRRWPRSLIILCLAFLAGLGATVWGLSQWEGARTWLFGAPPLPPIEYRKEAPAPAKPAAATPVLIPAPAPAPPMVGTTAPAGRTEALVAAFAARRAIERGSGLGSMESLLSASFAQSQPRALASVVAGAKDPVTLEALRSEFEKLAPELIGGGPDEGWWAGMQRALGSLIVVRNPENMATDPAARVERAQALMASGKVDAAAAEIARLPARKLAEAWLARARRHSEVQRALDTLEQAAMTQWPTAPPVMLPPLEAPGL